MKEWEEERLKIENMDMSSPSPQQVQEVVAFLSNTINKISIALIFQ